MRRLTALTTLLLLGIAGCGGGHHHPKVERKLSPTGVHYSVTVNNSKTTLSPPNPAHRPGFGLPPPKSKKFSAPAPVTGTTTYLMYDDVTLSVIPANPFAVGCYASGSFQNCTAAASFFPHAFRVSIATYAGAIARCLDIEPGDATPSQAPFWFNFALAHGIVRPCFYASASTMAQVRYYLSAAGIARSRFLLWDAFWTFVYHLDAGYDATQYYGGNVIDKSAVTPEFLGIQPGPPPPPPGPSHKQIANWRSARDLSFQAYHDRHCTSGLARDHRHCDLFAQRVTYFQLKLWSVYKHWSCWGPHARSTTLVCWIVRPEVSQWSQRRDSSRRVYSHLHCTTRDHRAICGTLRQRGEFFNARVNTAFKIYG